MPHDIPIHILRPWYVLTVLLLVGCNEYLDTCCTQRVPALELLVTAAHSILQLLQLLKKYLKKRFKQLKKKLQKREAQAHWTHGTRAHRKWIKMTNQEPSRTFKNPCLWPFDPSFARRISFRAVCAWPGHAKQNKQRPTGGYGMLQHHYQPHSEIGNRWKRIKKSQDQTQWYTQMIPTQYGIPNMAGGLMCCSIALSRCRCRRWTDRAPLFSPRRWFRGAVLRLCCRSPSPRHLRSAEASSWLQHVTLCVFDVSPTETGRRWLHFCVPLLGTSSSFSPCSPSVLTHSFREASTKLPGDFRTSPLLVCGKWSSSNQLNWFYEPFA